MSALVFTYGETVELYLHVKDTAGLPIDVSLDTFKGTIRLLNSDGTEGAVLAPFTCTISDGPGGVVFAVLDAISGTVKFTHAFNDKGEYATKPVQLARYDFFRTEPSGRSKKLASGPVTMLLNMTELGP